MIADKLHNIQITVPYNGNDVRVELIQQKILTHDFVAKDEKGKVINYQPGIYYQGTVKGDNSSLVAFSFFENDIAGVASFSNLGNLTVGKSKNKQDFMYVHNGDSVESALFEGGTITANNNSGPSFISTHISGAITIHFILSSLVEWYGWEATVNCNATMSVEDISNSNKITVYPNPTSSVLNIDAKKEITSVKLNDVSGKRILSKKSGSLKENLNIEHLPKGVYILTVEMKDQTVTKKIIKE